MRITIGRPKWMKSFSSGVNFATPVETLISRMDPEPDAARIILIDAFITALIAAGLWDKIVWMYSIASHDEQSALLNWKGDVYNGVKVGDPTFEIDGGYTSVSNTDYVMSPARGIDCGTLNDAHFAVWATNSEASLGTVPTSGTSGAGEDGTWIDPWTNLHFFVGALNGINAGTSLSLSRGYGMRCVFRTGSQLKLGYNASIDTLEIPADSQSINTFKIGGVHFNAPERQWAFASAGFGFTNAEYLIFQSAVNTYLDAVGALELVEDVAISMALGVMPSIFDTEGSEPPIDDSDAAYTVYVAMLQY